MACLFLILFCELNYTLSYAAMNREKCIPLMDNGHCHPTEVVSDKIALHITRPVRWTISTPPSTAL